MNSNEMEVTGASLDEPERTPVIPSTVAAEIANLADLVATDPSQLFSIQEAAKLLKVSAVYVRREIKAGQLPVVRLGRAP